MGIIQAFDYQVPTPNAAQVALPQAVAREADEQERQAIWDRARGLYVGYQACATRIKNRPIHVMILGLDEPGASA